MASHVAVLVDGDNVSAAFHDEIHRISQRQGQICINRVYLNAQTNSNWHDAHDYSLIHSGTGKNATDILMTIDAIEFSLRQTVDTMIIVSSDGDFAHLHRRLREHGIRTLAVGEPKAPNSVRSACSEFVELSVHHGNNSTSVERAPVTELDCNIRKIIAANSKNGAGMRLTVLGAKMHRQHGVKINERPERTWRTYLNSKPDLYDLDKAGQDAYVRFKPGGFNA